MKFLNVGILEFTLILLLAFIILGPKKAIKAVSDLAYWISHIAKSQFWHDIVTTSREIQSIPQKLMNDVNVNNSFEELEKTMQDSTRIIEDSQET